MIFSQSPKNKISLLIIILISSLSSQQVTNYNNQNQMPPRNNFDIQDSSRIVYTTSSQNVTNGGNLNLPQNGQEMQISEEQFQQLMNQSDGRVRRFIVENGKEIPIEEYADKDFVSSLGKMKFSSSVQELPANWDQNGQQVPPNWVEKDSNQQLPIKLTPYNEEQVVNNQNWVVDNNSTQQLPIQLSQEVLSNINWDENNSNWSSQQLPINLSQEVLNNQNWDEYNQNWDENNQVIDQNNQVIDQNTMNWTNDNDGSAQWQVLQNSNLENNQNWVDNNKINSKVVNNMIINTGGVKDLGFINPNYRIKHRDTMLNGQKIHDDVLVNEQGQEVDLNSLQNSRLQNNLTQTLNQNLQNNLNQNVQNNMNNVNYNNQQQWRLTNMNNIMKVPSGFKDLGYINPNYRIKHKDQMVNGNLVHNDILIDKQGNEVSLDSLKRTA